VPIVPEILRAKVRVFVDLYRARRELQHVNEVLEDRVEQRTSELQASNRKLQESEERLRLAGDAAQFGTYDFDVEQGCIYCSPQLQRLMGMQANDDPQMDFDDFVERVWPDERDVVRHCLVGEQREPDNRHAQEFRVALPNGRVRWLLDRGRAFVAEEDAGKRITRVMGTILDVTDRKQAEQRQLLLMAELDHRVKNILANVSAIARLSRKRMTSVDEFVDALEARILAISRAHDMLRRDNWTGISLKTYLSELLDPFFGTAKTNVIFEGEEIFLQPKVAQSLVLVFHELATNAAKYGALSVPEGQIAIRWGRNRTRGPDWVDLDWTESGGPPVDVDARKGFGWTVIRAASHELGAEIEHTFSPSGVCLSLSGPLEQTAKSEPCHALGEPSNRPGREDTAEQDQKYLLARTSGQP
jgi:PAS domain S-box-containing protein